MSGSAKKLGRKADGLIAALLTEPTHEAAAARAGVSEATLRRWLKDPTFLAAYRAARRDVVEAAVGRLQRAAGEAVDALRRNLGCGRPAVEVRAAEVILAKAVEAVELIDLAARLDDLERQVQRDGEGTAGTPSPWAAPTPDEGEGKP